MTEDSDFLGAAEVVEKMDRSSKQAMFLLYDHEIGAFRWPLLTVRRRQYMEWLGVVRRVDFRASHVEDQRCDVRLSASR
ncbi:hypothetical protein P775_23570 [Puniceibacterium antarcticum]|uniref:Uncharacterized protein n=1 Tax=Puniceibacterium antarcticum TaxID=1206336 RepID=A0A2G8R819_9RHOB|nr:hypothetical protein [Puniceibacterium antarcticum]PIL17700.1 hypothetical protein P775_23570 [Puniceibacterium antarcticum]